MIRIKAHMSQCAENKER